MNVEKQIEYWIRTGQDDLETAEVLLNNNRVLQGLFFCQLCIEKALKAHVVRCTRNVPPKIHNLSYLLQMTDITIDEDQLKITESS